ncbi:MAG: hypothetical protein H7273_10400 [Polaromonas sp.]|nr:hypothetical protein [Polaromonas sp.]
MNEKSPASNCLIGVTLFLAAAANNAQTLRDPTLPPLVQTTGPTEATLSALSIGTAPPSIIVRDGRSYVVLGSHLYAQGHRYGDVRIERISETEVWFRERNVLYKISRFPGARRSTAVPSIKAQPALPFPKPVAP